MGIVSEEMRDQEWIILSTYEQTIADAKTDTDAAQLSEAVYYSSASAVQVLYFLPER